MRTQKHKILSLVVLNMAKYTIISLILIAFVPILFIFNLFQNVLGGNSTFKNPKSQVDFKGGGGHFHLGPSARPISESRILISETQYLRL